MKEGMGLPSMLNSVVMSGLMSRTSEYRTGVDGDALGAEALAVPGGLLHVGEIASAGVAQGRYLVYVDAKSCHITII